MGKLDWDGKLVNAKEALDAEDSGGKYLYKKVEVFIPPWLYCEEEREKIIELMGNYPIRLDVYILPFRPDRNIHMINGNIMYEDQHLPEETYLEATIQENADDYNLKLQENRYNQFKAFSKYALMTDIRNLPLHPQAL